MTALTILKNIRNRKKHRFVSFLLTAAFILGAAVIPVSGEEAVTYKLFATNFGNSALSEINGDNPLEVWINGGKATYTVAGTKISYDTDSKIANVELRAYYDGNNIDMTKGKNYFWLTASADSLNKETTVKPKNANDYITVAVGKITAKQKPTTDGNPAYVGIYNSYKVNNKLTYKCIAVFPVVVKQAPAKLQAYSKAGSIANADKITSISVGLKESSHIVYINPLTNTNVKTGISLDSLSYKIEINNKNTSIMYKDSSGADVYANAGETVTLEADSSGGINFSVIGQAITKDTVNAVGSASRQDKTAASIITVTNLQSGKNVKLTTTVGNNVAAVAELYSDGTYVTPIGKESEKYSVNLSTYAQILALESLTVDLMDKNLIKLNASDGTVTTTPTIGVYKAKTGSDGVLQTYTYTDFLSTDKKRISFPATNKSDEIGVTLVGKDNYHAKISVKKKQDYGEPITHYVVIAYGITKESVLIIPVTLSSPQDKLEWIKIGTEGPFNVSGEGIQTNIIELTSGISNGVSFSIKSENGLMPTISLTNGATYTASTKKLKLDDNKQTVMTLTYGTYNYYYTINGKNYVSQELKSIKSKGVDNYVSEFTDDFNLEKTIHENELEEGLKEFEFILSDGTKLNLYSSEFSYVQNADSEAVFDKAKSTWTGFKTGDEITFTITFKKVKTLNQSRTYKLKYTVG